MRLKNFKHNQTFSTECLIFHDLQGPNDIRLVYYYQQTDLIYLGRITYFKYCDAFHPNKELDGIHIPWHISDALNEIIRPLGWNRLDVNDKWVTYDFGS